MSLENAILVGIFDGFTWIRCEGKGSFVTSPVMKECAESRIAEGERCLVIDLEACTGMDSTFMGQLASFSARLSKLGASGGVQVAGAGERNRTSLEDLGLDCLLEIDPPAALWRGHADEVRAHLEPYQLGHPIGNQDRAKHVLESHKILSAANAENARKFAGVVGILEKEVAEGERKAE
ncbi:STAS domain-containing protein [Haloferula sp. BvORR071]|uniref:STAS domain-containing protein n=1 Tax=Haloferula sp. BvORR071 TaxID=1396141 RepID=UPI0009466637|nr:STAS domain-containing protein [Haloferula sp. BvORR071]